MAFDRLASYGVSLNHVVADYVTRHEARKKSVTFKTLFEMFTATKQKKSKAYLRGLKYTLPRFKQLHDRIVADIEPAEIEAELTGMTPHVRNGFLRNLRAVFNLGVKRGKLASNPVSKLDFDAIKRTEVVTLSPAEAKALMLAAAAENDLLPFHGFALFAGVRPMELERLDWRKGTMFPAGGGPSGFPFEVCCKLAPFFREVQNRLIVAMAHYDGFNAFEPHDD